MQTSTLLTPKDARQIALRQGFCVEHLMVV